MLAAPATSRLRQIIRTGDDIDPSRPSLSFSDALAKTAAASSADTVLRLGRFFAIEPEFWLNLQTRYDLETASAAIGRALEKIASFHPRAA